MTSSMLFGDRRMASSRRSGMTVFGKVPKPINLPSQRLENHGADPSVEIVPKGILSWGSRSSSASNAWGSPSLSPKADGGTSPSYLSGHLSSGTGTRPSTAGSDKGHEPSSNAWGSNSRPSSASGALTSNAPGMAEKLRGSSVDHLNLAKSGSNHVDRASEDSALISVIERKMDDHFGNLLHAVEGLSARISQLETRLRRLENSVGDLKDSTEINHGKADGKLRQLENMLREVYGGMQDLRDKQEITEARLELAKLQMLRGYQQSENLMNNVQTVSAPGVLSSSPQQSYQPHAVQAPTLQVPSLPTDDPRTLPHQNFPPAQVPTQSSQSQIPSIKYADHNYTPPLQNPQPAPRMYCSFQVQQSQPPPTAPYHLSPPAPHPSLTSQLQQLPQQHPPFNAVDPEAQFSLVHNPGETSMPSQRYPPSFHITSNAPGLALQTQQQQYAGSIQYTHDPTTSNQYPEFSPGNMQPVQHSYFDDFRSHSGSQSYNSGPNMKHSQVLPASFDRSGGSSFLKLPTAKVLPHAIPMAASVDKESSSSGTGNRIPIDNVIDKVVAMGFRRDMVRATVRKMTENGQSVDVNLVLDKLMNNGEQPQSGGFGR